jgi:hypothetical protein
MPVVWSEALDPGQIWCVLGFFLASLLLRWLERGVAMKTNSSLNKVTARVGVSPSAVWAFLALLLAIVVMGEDGCETAGLLRSEAPWGFPAVLPAMIKWSASSAATPWLLAISPSTLIAEGRLLQVSSRCQFFNLQARVPRRRPCCFIMVFPIHLGPSGFVPGAEVGDRALKLHRIAGGQGPDCNLCFQFRVLSAKYEDCVVISIFLGILFVICNTTA